MEMRFFEKSLCAIGWECDLILPGDVTAPSDFFLAVIRAVASQEMPAEKFSRVGANSLNSARSLFATILVSVYGSHDPGGPFLYGYYSYFSMLLYSAFAVLAALTGLRNVRHSRSGIETNTTIRKIGNLYAVYDGNWEMFLWMLFTGAVGCSLYSTVVGYSVIYPMISENLTRRQNIEFAILHAGNVIFILVDFLLSRFFIYIKHIFVPIAISLMYLAYYLPVGYENGVWLYEFLDPENLGTSDSINIGAGILFLIALLTYAAHLLTLARSRARLGRWMQ